MKNILHLLLLISFFSFSQEKKRLALVIGNSDYEFSTPLDNPVNDANLIASKLDSLGFEVILEKNITTSSEFSKIINEFSLKRNKQELALIFYSGHAVQFNNRNYLLPTKGTVNMDSFDSFDDPFAEVIDVQGMINYLLNDTEAPTLIVLDACRTSPISDGSKGEGTTQAGLAQIEVPNGAVIAYSAKAGMKAYDGDGNNSLYAMSFAKHIMTEDLNHNDLFRRVREDVELASQERQTPDYTEQLIGGAIYLNPIAIKSYLNKAQLLIEREQYSEALEVLNESLNDYPNNAEVYRLIGISFKGLNKFEDAERSFLSSIKIDSTFSKSYFEIANLSNSDSQEYILNNYTKALSIETTKLNPDFILLNKIYKRLTNYYENEVKEKVDAYNLSIKLLNNAILKFPKNGVPYKLRGDINEKRGRYLQAVNDYENYIKHSLLKKNKEKNIAEAYYKIYKIYRYSLEDNDKALVNINKTIKIDSNGSQSDTYYSERANLHANVFNNNEIALSDYTNAITFNQFPENYYNRALFYKNNLGDYEKALEDLNQAIDKECNIILSNEEQKIPEDTYRYYFERAKIYSPYEDENKSNEIDVFKSIMDYEAGYDIYQYKYWNPGEKSIERAMILSKIGDIYYKYFEEYKKASSFYTKSLALQADVHSYIKRASSSLFLKSVKEAKVDIKKSDSLLAINFLKIKGDYFKKTKYEEQLRLLKNIKSRFGKTSFQALGKLIINDIYTNNQNGNISESVELKSNIPNFLLDGHIAVFFNNSSVTGNTSYYAIDLNNYSTDENGLFVIGNSLIPSVDYVVNENIIFNKADAIGIYKTSINNFPSLTKLTNENLVDMLVYNPTMQNSPKSILKKLVINEIDSDNKDFDQLEFLEIKSYSSNFSLDGYSVVFFNGSTSGNDSSYLTINLDGYQTDKNGLFVIGNRMVSPSPNFIIAENSIQNGADAVAIYKDYDWNFPPGTKATKNNLVDAIVYGTSDSNDDELMQLLGVDLQIDENENENKDYESIQRINDTQLNTDLVDWRRPYFGQTYTLNSPTPRQPNEGIKKISNGLSYFFDKDSYQEGDNIEVKFTLEEPVDEPMSIPFDLSISNDEWFSDFNTYESGVINLAANETSSTININLIDDSINEGDKDLMLTIIIENEDISILNNNEIVKLKDNDYEIKDFGTPVNPTFDIVSSTSNASYYDSLNGLSGENLITAIQYIISNPELVRAHSYSDIKDILDEADMNPNNSNEVWLVYSEEARSKKDLQMTSNPNGKWNREHIFPRSRGDFYDISADSYSDGIDKYWTTNIDSLRHANSDAHGIRAADSRENSARGNKHYGDYLGPENNKGSFKGDIARSLFFLSLRYNGLELAYSVPNFGYPQIVGEMGDLKTLLEWNKIDPADDFEMNRNNVIYEWQKNRNPFIDHPELVDYIWGDKYEEIWFNPEPEK